jgi:transcriptional regulator with XRE-family HTH domain
MSFQSPRGGLCAALAELFTIWSTSIMAIGPYLRSLREARGLGLRELARAIGRSPALVSRVETEQETGLGEDTLIAWAEALDQDPDLLLARAGRLRGDVVEAVLSNPQVFIGVVRQLRVLPRRQQATVLDELERKVKDGKW